MRLGSLWVFVPRNCRSLLCMDCLFRTELLTGCLYAAGILLIVVLNDKLDQEPILNKSMIASPCRDWVEFFLDGSCCQGP